MDEEQKIPNTIRHFDFVTLVIGLLLGMIMMLLLVWLTYYSRTLMFSQCPLQSRPCGGVDFYNDPGVALTNNSSLTPEDILYLANDALYYVRVPKNTTCTIMSNQTIPIQYPQYCSFNNLGGDPVTYRQTFPHSGVYQPASGIGANITADINCQPVSGQIFQFGVPLLEWDLAPITN